MRVWIKVTDDEYELPVAIADTVKELAEIVGTTESTIRCRKHYAARNGKKSIYQSVELD